MRPISLQGIYFAQPQTALFEAVRIVRIIALTCKRLTLNYAGVIF
jgi:hypothetical protein